MILPTSQRATESIVETRELITNTHMLVLQRAARNRVDDKTSVGPSFKGRFEACMRTRSLRFPEHRGGCWLKTAHTRLRLT